MLFMRGAIPRILFHFAPPLMSRLKLWNELRTNRARIGDSFSLLLRSPQHLAWNPSGGTRSSLEASHKRRFLVEFLKAADNPESNQKWVRVNRIQMASPRRPLFSLAPPLRGEGWGEGLSRQTRKIRVRGEPPHPALRHSRNFASASSSGRPPKAASASPRKRGEVER